MTGFDPRSVHVGFVVDKVVLRQTFLRVLLFSPVNKVSVNVYYDGDKKNNHLPGEKHVILLTQFATIISSLFKNP